MSKRDLWREGEVRVISVTPVSRGVLRPSLLTVTTLALIVEGAGRFASSQVVVDYASADGTPHPPIQLVIGEMQRRAVTATVLGHGTPRAGDLVSPVVPATPSPQPSPVTTSSAAPRR